MKLHLSLPGVALLAAPLLAAGPALAKPQACISSLEGFPTALHFDTEDLALKQNRTMRERLFGGSGDSTCPGYVTLRAMTPGLSDSERSVFCLQYDAKAETYTGFSEGARDAYVHCAVPSSTFCQRVNNSATAALEIAGAGAQAAGGAARAAVAEGAGAVVLSGSTASLTSTLGAMGSSAMSVLAAPGLLATAAVTVVAVGGAVYVCSE